MSDSLRPIPDIEEKPIDVVVVEDDLDFRLPLVALLEMNDCVVRDFVGAEEALESIWKRRPDVVVIDLNLGHEQDGRWLARAIRKEPPTSRAALLIVSGHPEPVATSGTPFDYYLRKPVEAPALVGLVRQLAANAREARRRLRATPLV